MAIIDRRYGYYKTTYKYDKHVCYNKACYAEMRDANLRCETHPVVFAFPKVVKGFHYTFLSREELIEYLTEVFKLTGIPFIAFSESDEWYWAHTIFPNKKRYKLFVSTIVRYAFEDNFALLTYFAMKNKELRKEMDIIHLVQLYISYFKYCDNHSLFRNGYTFYGHEDVKDWYKKNKYRFTNNVSYKIPTHNVVYYCYKQINDKCLDTLAIYFNNIINKVYEENKKDLCCRRS